MSLVFSTRINVWASFCKILFQSIHSPTSSTTITTSSTGVTHGIDNILSRPSQTLGAMIAASSAAAGAAAGFARLPPLSVAPWMGAIGKQLELSRPIYWPGLQSLVTNPSLWRERVNHSGKHVR